MIINLKLNNHAFTKRVYGPFLRQLFQNWMTFSKGMRIFFSARSEAKALKWFLYTYTKRRELRCKYLVTQREEKRYHGGINYPDSISSQRKIRKKMFLIVKILHPNLLCIDIAKESLAYFNLWTFPFYFYKLGGRKKKKYSQRQWGKDDYRRKREIEERKRLSILCGHTWVFKHKLGLKKWKLASHTVKVGQSPGGMVLKG